MNHSRLVSPTVLLIITGIALYLAMVTSISVGPMNISVTDSLRALLPMTSMGRNSCTHHHGDPASQAAKNAIGHCRRWDIGALRRSDARAI